MESGQVTAGGGSYSILDHFSTSSQKMKQFSAVITLGGSVLLLPGDLSNGDQAQDSGPTFSTLTSLLLSPPSQTSNTGTLSGLYFEEHS